MVIEGTTLLLSINTIIMVIGVIVWFKRNYVVLDADSFAAISECVEEYNRMIDEQEKEEVAHEEKAGGFGFQVYNEMEDEEDEEE